MENSPTTTTTPTKPNSPASTAKTKSVRLRQVEELLHARPESHAEPFAASDGDQRLHELEAAVERVVPGIAKRGESPQAVRRGDGERAHRADAEHDGDGEVMQPRARQESTRGLHQHRCGPEVRLAQQEHRCGRQYRHRLHESLEVGAQLVRASHGIARDVGEQHHPREFGDLEVHEAEAQPAAAAVHLVADARDQHQEEQHECAAEQVDRVLFPEAGGNGYCDDGRQQAHCDVDQLALEIEERLAASRPTRRSTPRRP
jgi:hypothetical protein